MEYLDAGAPPAYASGSPNRAARGWAPIVAGVVTFLIVIAAVGVVAGDWVARNIEMRALVTQIEVSEQAMEDTQTAITKAIDDFRAKTSPTAEDQTAFEDALKAAAATGLTGVTAGGADVESVRVLPWHTDIKAAQKAYLAHNHAWQDYLAKASKDAQEFSKNQDAVNQTFADAEAPMRAAIPKPDLFGLTARVDTIYAPPPVTDSGGGSGQQA